MSLDLPLYDDRHRALAARVAEMSVPLEAIAALGESGSEDEAGRQTIALSAAQGLCRLLVPRDFGGDGLDLRSLCVVREAMAYESGLVRPGWQD